MPDKEKRKRTAVTMGRGGALVHRPFHPRAFASAVARPAPSGARDA